MNDGLPQISAALEEIRARIDAATRRSGRPPGAVTLIGVAKTVPVERIRAAVAAGLRDLGENRVQEASIAVGGVGRSAARWHMVGHLQRNKVARALELFDRIHGLDDLELAGALSRRAVAAGLRLPVMVQVNVEGEDTKHGVAPGEVARLVERVAALPGLALDGVMSIGPPVDRPEDARPQMVRAREIRDAAERATGVPLPELSMGMSADYEVAVEEGSTMVRVGTALFGVRPAQGGAGGCS